MSVNAIEIDHESQLKPIAPEQVATECRRDDATIWLDLRDVERGELEGWLDTLGVAGLTRELCLDRRDRPGFYPLKRELLLVIPVIADPQVSREVDHVAFLCRQNLLLTVHTKSVLSAERLATLHESDEWLPDRSIVGLVSVLMIHLSQSSRRDTVDLRRAILALEERMDGDPETVDPADILALRDELLVVGAVVSDQLPLLEQLSTADRPFFQIKNAHEYMNCAVVNLRSTEGALEWLDQRLTAVRGGLQMYAQDKTNRRLGMLTILSAVFMPITLLTGIWGMNFEIMPELHHPLSYPIALGFMAAIGTGMYRFFRRGGWFD